MTIDRTRDARVRIEAEGQAALELDASPGWAWLESTLRQKLERKKATVLGGNLTPDEYIRECAYVAALEAVLATPTAAAKRYQKQLTTDR